MYNNLLNNDTAIAVDRIIMYVFSSSNYCEINGLVKIRLDYHQKNFK